ncbi:MAG: phosphoenolpyruvate carboxylase [Legionellaceae bacterium]|nr:phosphoenolpyruvate carboxylase [Legionellaceae bacterium]
MKYRFDSFIRSSSFGLVARRLSSVNTPVESPALSYINSIFSTSIKNTSSPTEKTKLNLIKQMVVRDYRKAEWRKNQPSGLLALIKSLPSNLSPDEKLNKFCEQLSTYYAMPVMTSHPTRVVSNKVIRLLYATTEAAMKLEAAMLLPESSGNTAAQVTFKDIIANNVDTLIKEPIVQTPNLTPREEAEYALFNYIKILEAFPETYDQLVDNYLLIHGGDRQKIASQLKYPLMLSFRSVYSWVRGDADGNYNVTAATMSQTVPAQQIAIIELYRKQIQEILATLQNYPQTTLTPLTKNSIVELEKLHVHLMNRIHVIERGIWFDEKYSEELSGRIIDSLTKIRTALPPELIKSVTSLINLIELSGFFGGIKEYVRQTTKVNIEVFDELLRILVTHDDDVRHFVQNGAETIREYHDLTREEKIKLHKMLSTNPDLFLKIKENRAQFSETTKRELERLLFVLKHPDLFPLYICSDTADKINLDEVRVLKYLASFLDGSLRMGQISEYAVNFLILCETPKDLDNLQTILADILDAPNSRRRIVKSGFISYVSGPSDLGKTGGIATHISLYRAQMKAEKLLNLYKEKYPELQSVKLRVLNGYGGDMKRRIGTAGQQSHSTFQGRDVYDELGAYGAYGAYINRVVGRPPESDLRVQELVWLEKNNSKLYNTLVFIEKQPVSGFQEFIERPSSNNLLRVLTNPQLEKILNTSSRAGSKTSQTDITQARAIGVVNLYILTGIIWDIFMSVERWRDLPKELHADLPLILEYVTVVKDVVYKTWYSIAVSNISRGWEKLGLSPSKKEIELWNQEYLDPHIVEKQLHHTLAHIETSAYAVLRALILFMPPSKQPELIKHFDQQVQASKSSHEIALELMDMMGGDLTILAAETREMLVFIRECNQCVDEYKQAPSDEHAVNAALSLRAGPIPGGPQFIANLRSPFGMFPPLSKIPQKANEPICPPTDVPGAGY